MKFINIQMRNFLSVGNQLQTINLDLKGLTLVLGQNLDQETNTSRNGVGKSTLLQAITYALYGEPLNRIRKDNLINKINGRGCLVCVEFEHQGRTHRIERGRRPNILRWFIDGTQDNANETEGDSRNTQEHITATLGMSLQLWRHIVALNTFTEPFLSSRVNDQRVIIEELLGITELTVKSEQLKEQTREIREAIAVQEGIIETQKSQNSILENRLSSLKQQQQSWQQEWLKKLEDLEQQVSHFRDIDWEHQLTLLETQQQVLTDTAKIQTCLELIEQKRDNEVSHLHNLQVQLQNTTLSSDVSIQRLERNRQNFYNDLKRLTPDVNELQEQLVTIQYQLNNPQEHHCNTCGQSLEGTDHLVSVQEKLKNQLSRVTKNMSDLETRRDSIQKDILQLDQEIIRAREELTAQTHLVQQLRDNIQEEINECQKKIQDLDKEQQEYLKCLEALAGHPLSDFDDCQQLYEAQSCHRELENDIKKHQQQKNPWEQQIQDMQQLITVVDTSELQLLQKLRNHQDVLYRLLTNRDSYIRRRIIEQNLSMLNHQMKHYLASIGLPHSVRFMSDLSVEINNQGQDFDFDQLSRGEKNRLILALSWSFRDVWENMRGSINLMFIDELLDFGLDTAGSESAVAILKRYSREQKKNVMLISHKEELVNRVSQVLMVYKESGFTRFEMAHEEN